jgi:predicted dehydrogenase
MRALIVGWGSIGQRHARCLRALAPDCELVVWRSGVNGEAGAEPAVRCVYSAEAAVAAAPDFAIIANPASFHVSTALALAEHGVPLLIEKPLSDRTDQVDALRRLCAARGVPVLVGYVLRFHPLLQAVAAALRAGAVGRVAGARLEVGQYLPDWRPGRDWQQTVSAQRALGGGALLELSHEIDLACWLFGQPAAVTARIPPATLPGIDVEDMAELLLDTADGTVVSIHLDMLRRPARRTLSVVGADGTIEADLIAGQARRWSIADGSWHDIPAPAVAGDNIFVRQLRHFTGCLADGTAPEIGLDDGERVLRVVAAARRSAAESRTVKP